MTYPIYVYGHPVLRKVAQDIDRNYPELEKFIADMFETMYKSDGLGLAAPQVGRSVRLFVIDGEPLAEDHPEMKDFKQAFINPKVAERKGMKVPMNEAVSAFPASMRRLTVSRRYAFSIMTRSGTSMTKFTTGIRQGLCCTSMIILTVFSSLTGSAHCVADW